MFRKYVLVLFVCILSLCFYQSLSYADGGNQVDIENIERELDNRERLTEKFKDHYNKIHGQVKELIDAYDATEEAVEKGKEDILFRAGTTVILTGAAYISGGSLAPAAWMGWNALKRGIETCTLDSSEYIEAIEEAIKALDLARDNMNAAYYGGTYHDYSGDITLSGFLMILRLSFQTRRMGMWGSGNVILMR